MIVEAESITTSAQNSTKIVKELLQASRDGRSRQASPDLRHSRKMASRSFSHSHSGKKANLEDGSFPFSFECKEPTNFLMSMN